MEIMQNLNKLNVILSNIMSDREMRRKLMKMGCQEKNELICLLSSLGRQLVGGLDTVFKIINLISSVSNSHTENTTSSNMRKRKNEIVDLTGQETSNVIDLTINEENEKSKKSKLNILQDSLLTSPMVREGGGSLQTTQEQRIDNDQIMMKNRGMIGNYNVGNELSNQLGNSDVTDEEILSRLENVPCIIINNDNNDPAYY